MSKGRRVHKGSKEFNDVQRLRYEIEKLKRENSRLRKQMSRVDIDRYHDIKELVIQNEAEEKIQSSRSSKMEQLKSTWRCHTCDEGYLKIFMLPRLDGTFYIRKCSNSSCSHKTKMKKYTPEVKGIKEEDDSEES